MQVEQAETGTVETVAETGTVAPVTETAAPTPEETMGEVYDRLNPPRAPDGKFAPRNPAETAPSATGTETSDQAQTKGVETQQASIDAPQSWSAEAKAKWAALPPDVQAYIAKRESESHEAITRQGTQVKAYEPVAKALEPVRDALTRSGMSEAEYIHNLVQAELAFQRNPAGVLQHYAKLAGVDLAKLVGTAQPETTDTYVDPALKQLQDEIASLKGELTQYRTKQQQSEFSEAQRALDAFKAEKDEKGAPKFPHFDEVRAEMARLFGAGMVKDLNEAYDRAVWANPQIRDRILSEQRKADEEKARKEAEKAAAEAKRLKSINLKPGVGTTPTKMTMAEEMAAVFDRMQGAA